jgi:hypothetical protein
LDEPISLSLATPSVLAADVIALAQAGSANGLAPLVADSLGEFFRSQRNSHLVVTAKGLLGANVMFIRKQTWPGRLFLPP